MITDNTKIIKGLVALALASEQTEVLQEMLRSENSTFKRKVKKEYNIEVSLIQAAGTVATTDGDDNTTDCIAYYEFKSDSISVVVALEGYWSSYDGYQYKKWYFCKPTPVTKVEYVKE
jgi:hypothetical protein